MKTNEMEEPLVKYSDMSEKELLLHIARNTDQIIGFLLSMNKTFDKLRKRFPWII